MEKSEVPQASRRGRKRQTVLDAAAEVFLASGYTGSSMDEITDRAGVSKQTVYVYFSTKEALFVEVVSSLTRAASSAVHDPMQHPLPDRPNVARWLQDYAERQLAIVLDPSIIRLRRLTISEAERFPELAATLWREGPSQAITALANRLAELHELGHLRIPDPARAAQELNWLIMGQPLNEAMLLGAGATRTPEQLASHAKEAVATFMAAYDREQTPG